MSKFLIDKFYNLEAYVPGEQPKDQKYIKLNTNEAPYPASPNVVKAIDKSLVAGLNLYCDPDTTELTQTIADFYGVDFNEVFIGNGSDEVLSLIMMAFIDEKSKVCFPDITYGFYRVFSKSFDLDAKEIPIKDDFTIYINDYINCDRNIIIANPNAPTGLVLTHEEIEKIVASNKNIVVVIDEAYVDFGSKSCVDLIKKYDNLIIVQTFSKSRNLAGARVGFAIASKEIIEDLNKIKFSITPYNINTMSQIAAIEAIKDNGYFEECNNKVIDTRERIKKELKNLGFKVTDSKTNFIFVTHDSISGEKYHNELRKFGVLTRHFKNKRINEYVRISIGTDKDMDKVVEITKKILSEINDYNLV